MARQFRLTDEQKSAVESAAREICILACAGSGKTTTLTRRIARLINDDHVDPSSVAAITFTVLAGDKLKYELSRVLKDQSATSRMFVGTIHSFCLQLLVFERVLPGEGFEAITESQQFVLLAKNWSVWGIQKAAPTLDKTSLIERLMASFDIIKMNCIPLNDLQRIHPEVARLYDLYNTYLSDNGFVDYADMLIRVRDLLRDDQGMRQRGLGRFPHLFVDEYQDVDPIQAQVVDAFRQSANVCVVGDDDQAIYQFRGADERNIQYFSESQHVVTLPLSENRRCPANVLTIAENNIARVRKRLPKSMYTQTGKGLVSTQQFAAQQDELAFIVSTINQLVASGAVVSYGQIGILLRSMASYGSLYVNALKTSGIPCVARGARTLFASEEIRQIVAIIEWFAKDNDAIEYLDELSPIFDGPIDFDILKSVSDKSSSLKERDFRGAGAADRDWTLLSHLHSLRIKYEERKFGSLLDLVHSFIEELALFSPERDALSKHNVGQFTRVIGEYEKIQDNRSLRSLATFIASYARNSYDEVVPSDSRADAVNILTVHQAKGLEFDFVFLPMLVEGRFPLERSSRRWLIDDSLFDSKRYMTSLDNERRLFYVACTRARKALWLLTSKDVGLAKPKSPSVFWTEANRAQLPDRNEAPVRPNMTHDNQQYLVIGYSSLEYYLTCPYRYQIVVEYGLEFPQAVFFQFGKLMHDILAHINLAALSGRAISLDEAETYLDQSFPLYYKNTNMRQYDIRKQQLRATKAIQAYYANRTEWIGNLVGIEGDLTYATGQALVKGRYDALVRNSRGKITIIDFKTGRPHTHLRTDFQMQFYSLAVGAQLRVDVDEAVVYYVEVDTPKVFSVNRQFLNQGLRNLNETIDGILTKQFMPRPNKDLCAQCEVSKLCPHKA